MYELGNNIFNKFKRPLQDIWTEIVSLPSKIVAGIQEMFKFIFVPKPNYFTDKFNNMKTSFDAKVKVDKDGIKQLGSVSSGSYTGISDFEGTVYGKRVKFIDLSWLDNYINRIHNLARGFMYPLMLLYNANQLYFLIRGNHIFSVSRKGD